MDATSECISVSVGIRRSRAELLRLLPPNLAPRIDANTGSGMLLCFVAQGGRSLVLGVPSGPFAVGGLLVPIAAPTHCMNVSRFSERSWNYMHVVWGYPDSPAVRFHADSGLAVEAGKVGCHWDGDASDSPSSGGLRIETSRGMFTADTGTVGNAAEFAPLSGLLGSEGRMGMGGQERATRLSGIDGHSSGAEALGPSAVGLKSPFSYTSVDLTLTLGFEAFECDR